MLRLVSKNTAEDTSRPFGPCILSCPLVRFFLTYWPHVSWMHVNLNEKSMAVSKAARISGLRWQMCLTDLLRSNQKTDAHSMKDKKRAHCIASCCRFESCSQRLSHTDTNIIVVTAPWIFNVKQWKFVFFFFCETVSALLRHPYICTHRCAFNADIYVYSIYH